MIATILAAEVTDAKYITLAHQLRLQTLFFWALTSTSLSCRQDHPLPSLADWSKSAKSAYDILSLQCDEAIDSEYAGKKVEHSRNWVHFLWWAYFPKK